MYVHKHMHNRHKKIMFKVVWNGLKTWEKTTFNSP